MNTLKPYGIDPIFKYFISFTGKKLALICLFSACLPLVSFLLTIVDGTFFNSNMQADLVHDIGDIVLYLFGFPLTILVIIWYSHKITSALDTLKENEIVVISDDEWAAFIEKANKIFSKSFLSICPYVIASIVTLFLIRQYVLPGSVTYWYSLQSGHKLYWAAVTMIPVYFFTFFSLSSAIILIIKTYIVLKDLFNKYKIEVQVLHPDSCGGLSSLGSLSKTLNLWIFIVGIISATNIYMNIYLFGGSFWSIFEILIVIGYIISAYVVFFMPLHATHKSMKNAKFNSLHRINKSFVHIDNKIKKELDNCGQIEKQDIESLENLKKLYDIAENMPIYPYDIKTVMSFLGSIIVPILLIVFETLFKSLF